MLAWRVRTVAAPHARGWLGNFTTGLTSFLTRRAFATLFILTTVFAAASQAGAQPLNPQHAPPTIIFDRAEFIQNNSLTPPSRDATWTPISLPDSWGKQSRPREGYGWYRLTFIHRGGVHDGHDSHQRSLYIPRVTNNVEIFLNRYSLGLSGRLGPKPEETWNVAQFFYVPASGFIEGENEILIRLHPDSVIGRPGLSLVYFGDTETLRAQFALRYFVQSTAPQLISALLVVMAFFSFLIWARRRTETLGYLFGWMAIAAIARLFHLYLRDAGPFINSLAVPALVWLTVLQARVALNFAERGMPRTERAMTITAILMTVGWYLGAFAGHAGEATLAVYMLLAIFTPVLIFLLIVRLASDWKPQNILMVMAMILNAAFGIHDFFNFVEALNFDRLYLQAMGLPLIMFAMAAMLVRRFVTTLKNYEELNTELAVRVDNREKQLAQSYEQLRAIDQQRATAEERQRLMRDMHDGIGSHLMSTLALARMGKLSSHQLTEVLTDCIDELKITIDSLEPVERDLLVVLGNLRYRLEPRLNNAGISLDWDVKDLPPLEYLAPENVRSVLRIVQEAFTNTLKHADAKRITLSTAVDYAANEVVVRVTDDGKGMNAAQRAGRGLENMRNRAAQLKGRVEIAETEGGGTRVELYLPISAAL
jgi:signal transduction histidine kinase